MHGKQVLDPQWSAQIKAEMDLYIGVSKELDAASFFPGLIDEIRFYDVALAAEEIAELAQLATLSSSSEQPFDFTIHYTGHRESAYVMVNRCKNVAILHDNDGGWIDEYLQGLFFTPTRKCLDLRGPKFTW